MSGVNSRADAVSNRVRDERPEAGRWHVPRSWVDNDSLFWGKGDALICDVRPVAWKDFCWGPETKVDSLEDVRTVRQPLDRRPDAALRQAWEKVSPLQPKDMAMARLFLAY